MAVLQDGTIEVIATDHAPHTAAEKARGLAGSAMGVVGLECAFAVLNTALVGRGIISFARLVEAMAVAPRRIFSLGGGTIAQPLCRYAADLGFELVVADDGSDEDFFPLTRKILAENGFTGAKFVKLTPNGGTVKNVLNGAKQAAGKWVFTVSPGDYLYDADTVAWLLEVLRRDAPRVAFGRLACYADRNGAPIRRRAV